MQLLPILLTAGIVMTTNTQTTRRITFEIKTREPLPIGEQVFVTGNDPAIGSWKPAGLPLSRIDDDSWTGSADLPTNEPIAFKVTRGSWDTERLDADGKIAHDTVLEPGGDYTVELTAPYWKDQKAPPTPQIVGNYKIHDAFHSEFLRYDRKVIVWLPPSYDKETDRSYPVLYMHDGQQVFDPQTSTHGHDWQVDEWCQKLIEEGTLQEIIVVAAYCTDDRFPEYDPAQIGDDYVSFMIDELKSFIDENYRTKSDRDHTAVAGASMGGTISFYLAWTRPDIYFGAACLSPAFRFSDNARDLEIAQETKTAPDLKLFLSCGQGDELEEELIVGMREMAELLRERKFKDNKNLLVVEDPEAKHNEETWAKITDQWLTFLFGK